METTPSTQTTATSKPASKSVNNNYKELGVLWSRTKLNSDERYLSGMINLKGIGGEDKDIPVIVFTNKNKQKDTHPDLRIYLSEKRDKPAAPVAPASTPKVAVASAPVPEKDLEPKDVL